MKLTNHLLKKAAMLAEQTSVVQGQLTEAFNARYGVTYSDVDADAIIEILDYHGGSITVEECDQIMSEAGHPPLTRTGADK